MDKAILLVNGNGPKVDRYIRVNITRESNLSSVTEKLNLIFQAISYAILAHGTGQQVAKPEELCRFRFQSFTGPAETWKCQIKLT